MKHKSGRKVIPVIPAAMLDARGFRLLPLIPEKLDAFEMHRHEGIHHHGVIDSVEDVVPDLWKVYRESLQ